MKTLKQIIPLTDFRLECIFDNGSRKVADIKPFLKTEAFMPLKDLQAFKSVTNKNYFAEWAGYDLDLSADTLWHISTDIN